MGSQTRVPNLELIEYKAKLLMQNDKESMKKLNNIKKEHKFTSLDFDVETFSQTWGNTCTGFDIAPDGMPMIGGCAMTKEYTTIVHELLTDTYLIFFGDKVCYSVKNANQDFLEDIKNHCLASLSIAKNKY